MQQTSEVILHEPQDHDAWVCICSNTPSDDGFCPIDEANHEVEPTVKDWRTGHYVCAQCGRVIDPDTLCVVRRIDIESFVPLRFHMFSERAGTSEFFTPLNEKRTRRLKFKRQDVTVLNGQLGVRKAGKIAQVEIAGTVYIVFGYACGLVGCDCDAFIVPVQSEVAA